MVQEVLKKATAEDHNNLEAVMYVKQLLAGTLTLEQYMHLIYTNYTVHLLAEQQLYNLFNAEIATNLNIAKREKLSALKKDIAALGMDSSPIINTLPAFEIKSEAAALGAMYVMEGATLGGQVVLKMLQKNKAVNYLEGAFNYYNVYGNDLGKNWKQFCAVINDLPHGSIQEAIAGSKWMYSYFNAVHTSIGSTAFKTPEANHFNAPAK